MSEDYQPTDINALYLAVGFTVITWAHIEQLLDMSIAIAFHNWGGKTIDPRLPRTLKGKLAFMRKSLRRLKPLIKFRQRGLDLMQRISNMKQQRHDLVHGAITSVTGSEGTFEFRRLDAKQDMHHTVVSEFDLKNFPAFSQELSDLGTDMAHFVEQLVEKLGK